MEANKTFFSIESENHNKISKIAEWELVSVLYYQRLLSLWAKTEVERNKDVGAAEMMQWLRAHTTLPEDPSSIFGTHISTS